MSEKNRELLWILLFGVVIVILAPTIIWGFSGGIMGGMMHMIGFGWGPLMFIPIVFYILMGFVVYYLLTGSERTERSPSHPNGRAVEILRERYANGEITKAQFSEMKRELES